MAKRLSEEARQRKNERQREYEKRTNYEASRKYLKENSKRFVIQVMFNTEADILQRLEEEENKAGYIKGLIRKDIQNRLENSK